MLFHLEKKSLKFFQTHYLLHQLSDILLKQIRNMKAYLLFLDYKYSSTFA